MGAGLGMAMGISGTVGNMANQVFQNAPGVQQAQQTSAQQTTQDDPVAVLGKLKQLLDAGLITADDYNAKKTEVLSKM